MAVYVDNAGIMYRGKPRYHLAADSLEEIEQPVSYKVPRRAVFDGDWVLWPPADPDPLGPPEPHKAKPIYNFARYGW